MLVELLNVGTELMLGRTLNTHQQWLCRRLADLGYEVTRQVAVPDTGRDIQQALREALGRADLVIVTGGLGPTSDDITRDYVAQLLGTELEENKTVLKRLEDFFISRSRAMPVSTRVQAMVPRGALVLLNEFGTAPGLAMEVPPGNAFRPGRSSWIVMLPGPPRELHPMFTDEVEPLLKRVLPVQAPFACRTLRATGIGESVVEERVAPPLQELVKAGLELGYCAQPGQVDVRVAARGAEADSLVARAEATVRERLGGYIFGVEDELLESVLVRELTARGETLALAESCTGGCIAHRITNVPGASAVLLAGLVTYTNEAKQKFLAVDAGVLAQHGAVSEPVARQMAEGARRATGATYALAVTGIAGPSGGSAEKPMGTVFIALAGPFATVVRKNLNPWERLTFKNVTAQQAMEMLRQRLVG